MKIESFGGKSKEEQFCDLALNRARSFLSDIDPMLAVQKADVVITPEAKGQEQYGILALRFWHQTNLSIHWTMDVAMDKEYFDTKFEEAVRKAFQRQQN